MFHPRLPQKEEVGSILTAEEDVYSMAEIFVSFFAFKPFAFMAVVYTILTPRVESGGEETFWVGET